MASKSLNKSALLVLIAEQTETDRKTAARFLDVLAAIGYKEVKKNHTHPIGTGMGMCSC